MQQAILARRRKILIIMLQMTKCYPDQMLALGRAQPARSESCPHQAVLIMVIRTKLLFAYCGC